MTFLWRSLLLAETFLYTTHPGNTGVLAAMYSRELENVDDLKFQLLHMFNC